MCARTADGVNSAVAWVNILSACSGVNLRVGSFAASQAAALSLGQSLRGEFRASGLRVMHVFVGPTDDDWRNLCRQSRPRHWPPIWCAACKRGWRMSIPAMWPAIWRNACAPTPKCWNAK